MTLATDPVYQSILVQASGANLTRPSLKAYLKTKLANLHSKPRLHGASTLWISQDEDRVYDVDSRPDSFFATHKCTNVVIPQGDKPNILNLQRLRASAEEDGKASMAEVNGASDSEFSGVSPTKVSGSSLTH